MSRASTTSLCEAILLLGGSGKRLYPLTRAVNKHLLPVYRSSLAENSVRWLAASGIGRIVAVTSPDAESAIRRLLLPLVPHVVDLELVVQPQPRGTGDAVRYALEECRQDQIVILFGDNVFERALPRRELRPLAPAIDACCFGHHVSSGLRELGAIRMRGDEIEIVPKPHPYDVGTAIVGLFLARVSSLARSQASTSIDLMEEDLMQFISECSARKALEVRFLEMKWHDAGRSHEALWQAGALLRDTQADA